MPIVPIQRITSSTTNVVSAATRDDAVTALLSGTAPNVVDVGNVPTIWPQPSKFDNDNTSLNSASNPQFIWTQNTFTPGETHGFAASSIAIPLTINITNDFLIALTVFGDNAVTANIIAIRSAQLMFPVPGLNVDLNAGSQDPTTGVTTDIAFPYNWQKVRFYSIPVSLGPFIFPLNVQFIFSFQVTNYLQNGAINTAGLSFAADIYQSK